MEDVSESYKVKFVLGPWLVGSCFEFVLTGVLCCQFINYFTWYPDDKRSLRIAVLVLLLLSILKSIESFAALWIFLIENFGDINKNLMLSVTAWWDTANPLLVAIVDFYVQCYFCSRLLAISKSWVIVAPVFSLFFFALISMVLATYYITTSESIQITNWFAAHFSSLFAGDMLLTALTAYYLIKTKKNVLPQTVGLINALVRLTFQTAAPAALFALFTLIFSQMNRAGHFYLGFVEIAFNQPLPKLYAISMMWTLNARRTMTMGRSALSGSSSEHPSGTRVRTARRTNGDVELGRIEVLTQTETTRHVDVRDMFDPARTTDDHKHGLGGGDHKLGSETSSGP
ncbi:hypothetical protein R3P38DRAFT_1192758 [Favolaschia claudopus]|uniref:DUF6534 domain-containing protein n=1 Tax=Favolaschia claudopus TaxID=2862362 RepID=A0AAW0E3S0_9AGAR